MKGGPSDRRKEQTEANLEMALSLQEQAYEQIKARILSLEYPPNSIISEASLLRDLDMSRTPVRESLIRLEHEHFIRILPKRGIQIASISMREVNMLFDSRCLIEPFCLKSYHQYIDLERLSSLLDVIRSASADDISGFYETDNKLHLLLAASGPNMYLNDTLKHLYDQHNRIRGLCTPNMKPRFEIAAQEHVALCEAILEHDIDKACGLLAEHLNTSKVMAVLALSQYSLPIS